MPSSQAISEPAAPDAPDAPVHVLQRFMFPMPGRPVALYVENGMLPARTDPETGVTRLERGAHLSGNSYFNSFYLTVWRAHSAVGPVGLRLVLRGHAVVRLIGIDGQGRKRVIKRREVRAERDGPAVDLVLWTKALSKTAPDGGWKYVRLYAELTALDDCEVRALDWVTDRAPQNDITLSIGLCTFNREAQLKDTLTALTAYRGATPQLRDIYVVNQGAGFADPDLARLIETGGMRLVEQGNLGGCGGFNRSMYEAAYQARNTTHHLLMDDDIILDARVIDRSLAFLGYAPRDVVVGGQMLVLQEPVRLFEAGARMDAFWVLVAIGHDLDLSSPAELSVFDDEIEVDYNAWWYCMIPTEVIRREGLSPPVFIHGDDIEYGCRLKKAGIPTIPLPGVGVWHESFAFKSSDWMLYYDLRNRLINATLHPEIATHPDVLYVLGFLFNFILSHRYRAARIAGLAVRDYLAGPDIALGEDSETRHQDLMAFSAALPAPPVTREFDPDLFEERASAPMPYGTWPTIQLFVVNFFRIAAPRRRKPRPLIFRKGPIHPKLIGAHAYLLPTNSSRSEYLYLEPSRPALWLNMVRAFWLTLRYMVGRKRATARWQAELPAMQSREAWEKTFGIKR